MFAQLQTIYLLAQSDYLTVVSDRSNLLYISELPEELFNLFLAYLLGKVHQL